MLIIRKLHLSIMVLLITEIPFIITQLALKDAEKVVNFQSDSVKSYILKANALILVWTIDHTLDFTFVWG